MELIKPMEPILRDKVIKNEAFIHQVKWDGIRGLTYIQNGQIRIFTKRGKERTEFYPEIHELRDLFGGKTGIMDGEIIVLDNDRPSFSHILMRERVRSQNKIPYYKKKYPIKYVLFDVLFLNGTDLRPFTLIDRQEILNKNFRKSENITLTDNFSNGEALLNLMRDKNYEGIVSKKINSSYYEGKKHEEWFKTKIIKKLLAVVGGITWKENFPNAIMVGIYLNDKFYYLANVRSGLSQKDLYMIKDYAKELEQSNSPFENLKKASDVSWFKPLITCWVSYLEWNNSGGLRHPKLLGFATNKPDEADGKEYTL